MSSESELATMVDLMSHEDLAERKEEIAVRLVQLDIKEPKLPPKKKSKGRKQQQQQQQQQQKDATSSSSALPLSSSSSSSFPMDSGLVPYDASLQKTDTHWDFVLKEMMWLAADFQSERKRQVSLGRRVAMGMKQFHKTVETRRARQLAEAELKRRRWAAKIGREVKGWWTKIERVIAYKQKMDAEKERRQAMNQQLVSLVRQTERYGESLAQQHHQEQPSDDDEEEDKDDEEEEDDDEPNGNRKKRKRRRSQKKKKTKKKKKKKRPLTIEEALAAADASSLRRRKRSGRDYTRVQLRQDDTELYGESTTSDSGSDGSFVVDSTDDDDETTLLEAEAFETLERRRRLREMDHTNDDDDDDDDDDKSFMADPDELKKLQEESSMDINDVLNRLQQETESNPSPMMEQMEEDDDDKDDQRNKRVSFAPEPPTPTGTAAAAPADRRAKARNPDPGNEADDDGDASDVEDFDDNSVSDGSDEFQGDVNEVDDETTIAAEERLGRDMSVADEINMLEREGSMPIEELRRLYSLADNNNNNNNGSNNNGSAATNGESHATTTRRSRRNLGNASGWEDVGTEGDPSDESDDGSGEFVADPAEIDDETTIAAEERLGREMSVADEISLLQQEGEMSIEELRKLYSVADDNGSPPTTTTAAAAATPQQQQDAAQLSLALFDEDDATEQDEFVPTTQAVDDETTIEAEERLGREMSPEEELKLLQQENEIPVEQLRSMYAAAMNEANDDNDDDDAMDIENGRVGPEPEKPIQSLVSSHFNDNDDHDMEDYVPEGGDAQVDDETTIEVEERLGREMTYEEELAMLKRESEMSVEDLQKLYGVKHEDDGKVENEESDSQRTKRSLTEAGTPPPGNKRHRSEDDKSDKGDDDEGLAALKSLQESEEKARATLASRPFLLTQWVKLRAYQQVGLNWLVSIQSRRLNGILADEMGLGKTLQTISLLAYLAAYKGVWGPHLVVVPTSCIVNWETEIKRFCPALKVLCYYGSAKRRKELRTGWTKANWYHIVVTSYQLAVQDAFAFKRKKWYYLILDEAHNIKNFQSQRWQTLINFNTQRRLLLTGTPLQNNLTELWSLLHFLMPHVFRSRKEFAYWFSNPMNSIIDGSAKRSDDLISRLHAIIRPFVLRRLKKDVETQMPGKFEHIVKCPMSRRQMFLYEEFMARSSTRNALKKGGNFMGMMNVLMQLRKVCNHPDLFEPRAVITPFAMGSIDYSVPRLVVTANDAYEEQSSIGSYLSSPLWCGSGGALRPATCADHDDVEAEQLLRLQIPRDQFLTRRCDSTLDEPLPEDGMRDELKKLLTFQREEQRKEHESKIAAQSIINRHRCSARPFPYSNRLHRQVLLRDDWRNRGGVDDDDDKFEILSTPAQLLRARKSIQERADDMDEVIKKFTFCVPKAGAARTQLDSHKSATSPTPNKGSLNQMLLEPVRDLLRPFQQVQARLSSFFPDKRLVQFDAGKLQTLAGLLHNLKRGGHRALIFTQMSKMLDVLEAFLNLNGHTYVRLDGSTGVDRRQRLMDRFNNDERIFCFILSTRSGGLGINLTGADTVIFYDSDWNPAMDAQAQDRAHRIGQTRDVHIYRLITEHSIEENIWTKAQQKRNLDLIVMDEGKFDAAKKEKKTEQEPGASNSMQDVFSKGGLQDILGVLPQGKEDTLKGQNGNKDSNEVTKEQLEMAMASLEDEDDVAAMRGAQREAQDELKEFDETIEYQKDPEEDDEAAEDKNGKDETNKQGEDEGQQEEEEMVKEFNAWQTKVGMDASAIEASLAATERYGLGFREEIDPYFSVFAIMEHRRRMEAMEDGEDEVAIEELERLKALEEQHAFTDGDLLGTKPPPEDLPRQRHMYCREKSRLRASKKVRKLNGANWIQRTDARFKAAFWYNEDTGEAVWDKPKVLRELAEMNTALEKRWVAMPIRHLVRIMEYLVTFPERTSCAQVCQQWRLAATDISFVRHVLPVEVGSFMKGGRQMDHNHYLTIAEALSTAQPGDTIELGDGHYWVNEPGLAIDIPLKFVGDENDPSHVVIELSGAITWRANGFLEGVTLRRPKITGSKTKVTHELMTIAGGARVDMVHCVLNNAGSSGHVVSLNNSRCHWYDVTLKGSGEGSGVLVGEKADLDIVESSIDENHMGGIVLVDGGHVKATNCRLDGNVGPGVWVKSNSRCELFKCRFGKDSGEIIVKEAGSTCAPCQGNMAILAKGQSRKAISGVRFNTEDDVK